MNRSQTLTAATVIAAAITLQPAVAAAHCDTLDGPVVKAAERALESGDLGHVLMWVAAGDETEIRAAFEQVRAVRVMDPRARALADRYFFETVVRVHRAGEGEPYTGLKPAGLDAGPAIRAADAALDQGSPAAVLRVLTAAIDEGLHTHFEEALAARGAAPGDVERGRRFVRAYVAYLHYVERVFESSRVAREAHLHGTVK